MTDWQEIYRRLTERHQEVQEKMTEIAALARTITSAQHQYQRVELQRYELLCEQLEAALEDYARARQRFGHLLQGEA